MDSDHEKDKLDEESSAYEDYDDEFEQLKQDMRDLIKINNNLNVALEESKKHNRSILILTTLMVVCISSMYGYYTMNGGNESEVVKVMDPSQSRYNPLQKEVADFFVTDSNRNITSGDDLFYNTMAMRLRMMPFNAMAIKSPLIIHDKLGMVGGGASGVAVGLRGALKTIPIVGTAYFMFEMGVRAATDFFILQNVANNSLNFFDSVNPIFYMKFSVVIRKIAFVDAKINQIKDKWQEEHRNLWGHGFKMNDEAKEGKLDQEIVKYAEKLADYLSRIIVTGYAQKVFLECYQFTMDNEDVCYNMLAQMAVNHPKGHNKISFDRNRANKKENQERSERLKKFLTDEKKNIPQSVKDAVLEYWNIVSKGEKFIKVKKAANAASDEMEMKIITKKEYKERHKQEGGLLSRWKKKTKEVQNGGQL